MGETYQKKPRTLTSVILLPVDNSPHFPLRFPLAALLLQHPAISARGGAGWKQPVETPEHFMFF